MKLVIAFLLFRQHSLPYLSQFLPSLKEASAFLSNHQCQILVADNSGSDKDNRDYFLHIESLGDKLLEYYDFQENLGFARAYNILIKRAFDLKAEYFLMINPDILIDKSAIANLISAMDNNNSLASVAPKILRWDFKNNIKKTAIDSLGIILRPGLNFKDLGQGHQDRGQFNQAKILGPSGAAALFRLSALEDIKENNKYLDENFFMYKEDCDLVYRLSLKDWNSQLIPSALFYHDRSASGGKWWQKLRKRKSRSRLERGWSFQGQHYLFFKHWSKQNFFNKILICFNIFKLFIFSLIFEQFLLKEYFSFLPLTKKR